jgi:hypothetical protein
MVVTASTIRRQIRRPLDQDPAVRVPVNGRQNGAADCRTSNVCKGDIHAVKKSRWANRNDLGH